MKPRLYFPYVEGLRGLTALYVFLSHIRLAVASNPEFARLVALTPFLNYGHYAVSIFIVISGYCLGAPVARRPGVRFDIRAFAIRRFRRIYPAYFAALVLSVLAFFYWSAAYYHHTPPMRNVGVAFIAHVALVHNLFDKTRLYFSGPMWSVGVESQMYVVFAVLLVPLWKTWGVAAQLAVALTLALLPHYLLHGFLDGTCPWYLGLFSMGIWAAALSVRPQPTGLWRAAATFLVFITVVTLVRANVDEDAMGYGPFIWTDLLLGVSLSVFFVAAEDWMVARALAWKPAVFLGTFAYSISLIHWPLINVLRETLRRVHADQREQLVAYLLLVPVVLAASYGFYALLERPFMSTFLRKSSSFEPSLRSSPHDVDQAPHGA